MTIPKYFTIKNSSGQTTAYLSPEADGVKDCYQDNRLNGESTFTFKLPANSGKIDKLTPDCQIWAGGKVYSLLKDEAADVERDQQGKLWAVFMAKECWSDLVYQYPEPYITNDPNIPTPADFAVIIVSGGSDLSGGLYTVGSAGHALHAVLAGSGWTIGTVDVPGTHDLETEKTNRLELVKAIQNIWGGYLVFDSENKTVSLRNAATWQNYTGFQVRYAKNLKHIKRTQSNRIITKLYPFGHDDLDISSVNGGIKYITNTSYTSAEYTGIYKNQDIYDATELLEKSTAELAILCQPRYQYTVKIADLRTLPEYSHEDFAVGDMADVIDPSVAADSPRIRILRHRYNLFQSWECEIELGDPLERFVEQLKASFDTSGLIDGKFNGSGRFSGYSLEDLTVENAKIKSLSADKIIANTMMINVFMTVGTGDNVFKADANGIYLGNAQFSLAPFSVNMAGQLTAAGATITGGTIRTDVEGNVRMELTGSGIISYDETDLKEGICIETGDYGYSALNFYQNGVNVGSMEYNASGVFSIGKGGATSFYIHDASPVGDWTFGAGRILGQMVFSSGTDNATDPNWERGYIYEDENGLHLKHINSDGSILDICSNDDGIIQTGNTGAQGLRNIHISTTEPASPQTGDLWINPEDYSTCDPLLINASGSISASSSNVIFATGTITITLFTAAGNNGVAKTIKNVGSGTVTIDGYSGETIDGAATKDLAANERCTIMSDGTNWQVI